MPEDGIEPPFDSGSDSFDFETVANELLAESLGRTDCGGRRSGFCCSYHEGFRDGMDELMTRFEQWLPKVSDTDEESADA
jgi:hypothetical protein